MNINPFNNLPKNTELKFSDWSGLSPESYDKRTTSPYTKARIILMNGTEFESNWFLHQFHRHCLNNDIRRTLALVRRQEQQQQKRISALKPTDETQLETTIGYEQLAVDLTADMAKKETVPFVKAQLDFALLEDFDHLYRYSDLLDMEQGIKGKDLVGSYTEITPGRPTVAEHRHPFDDVRFRINDWRDNLLTRLHTHIITAAEQQTMNFYMNVGSLYPTEQGRKLYSEIAMIEEQHVTGYGSLMDPSCTWLENWVFHEYTECYLYYSCIMGESDQKIKKIWEEHYEQELLHLKIASETLRNYEGRVFEELFPVQEFPSLIELCDNKEYVRKVMNTVRLTGLKENTVPLDELAKDETYFIYQGQVNKDIERVPSHNVIESYIKKHGEDYRFEVKPSAEPALRVRNMDNVNVGRVRGV